MSFLKKTSNRQSRVMQYEQMEERKLFAADIFTSAGQQLQMVETRQLDIQLRLEPTIHLQDGRLSASGTHFADEITIEQVSPLTFNTVVSKNGLNSVNSFFSAGQTQHGHTLPITALEPRIKVTIADTDGEVLLSESFAKSLVDDVYVTGHDGADTIHNKTNIVSTLLGGRGNDTLRGGTSTDVIVGDAGNDRLYGYDGNDSLNGSEGNDILYGYNGHDTLIGGIGNDSLYGHAGNDYLHGSDGDDYLSGSSGDDYLYGNNGDDTLSGSSGDDVLYGGNHHDKLYGGSGDDHLDGDAGNDVLYGHNGHDFLRGDSGNDFLDGGSGADRMYGSSGHDALYGRSGNDDLYGGGNNDNLYGGTGADYLSGGSGDDGVFGGEGTDELRGGSGDDRFLVHGTADTLLDKNSNDAKVIFEDGEEKTFNFSGGAWATISAGEFEDSEIEEVDRSLADLHHQVGNTTLLKKANGDEVIFRRLGNQTAGNFNVGGVNSGGIITLLDASFDSGDDWLAQVVFHEVGHNFDTENAEWEAWRDISGWRTFSAGQNTAGYTQSQDDTEWYQNGSVFARNYGRRNAREDFATYFAKVMMDDNGWTYNNGVSNTNAAKEAFMDDFFASI